MDSTHFFLGCTCLVVVLLKLIGLLCMLQIIKHLFWPFWSWNVPKEIKKSTENKNVKSNTFRTQARILSCVDIFESDLLILWFQALLQLIILVCFHLMIWKKNDNLIDQTKFRLNGINNIKDYFNAEIQERKKISKNHVNILLPLIILTRI